MRVIYHTYVLLFPACKMFTQGKRTRMNLHEIRANFMRILRMKRDEKQAYEYRMKKTHDIRANFTRFHAIFI